MDKDITKEQIFISVLAGGLASLGTDICYYPLDTIKTRIQASSKKVDFVKSSKAQGGISTTIIITVPFGMIFFFVYDNSKKILANNTNINPFFCHILSAANAEFCGAIVMKQQMQVGLNSKLIGIFKDIYHTNGIKSFYAGFGSLILRELPFAAIQFSIYELLKKRSLRKYKEINLKQSSINGFISGSISAMMTTPIDVVKSKLMTQREKYYISVLDCSKKIYLEEGLLGFTRGITIRTGVIGITGIIFFGLYEQSKRILTVLHKKIF